MLSGLAVYFKIIEAFKKVCTALEVLSLYQTCRINIGCPSWTRTNTDHVSETCDFTICLWGNCVLLIYFI